MPRLTINPDGIPLTSSERKRRWKEMHQHERMARTVHLPTGASVILDQDAAALNVSDSTYLAAAILLAQEHHDQMAEHIKEVRRRFRMQVHPRSSDRGPRVRRGSSRAPLEKLSGGR